MDNKFLLVALMGIMLICPWALAQEGSGPAQAPNGGESQELKIEEPTSPEQAKELFLKAYEHEKKEEYEKALKYYDVVYSFYRQQQGAQYKYLAMVSQNNMAVLTSNLGKYRDAIPHFQSALRYANQLDLPSKIAEVHHKLGIIYDHLAEISAEQEANKHDVYPTEKVDPRVKKLFNAGTFYNIEETATGFRGRQIALQGTVNPYERENELYTKLINLKLRSDFEPDSLIVPDTVKFLVQVNKEGYYPLIRNKDLLKETEYSEIDEIMVAKPREVEADITEDYFRQGPVNPDEITLQKSIDGELRSKPVKVGDKETFKPGKYLLRVQKSGYETIEEKITIYPAEGAFELERRLISKMREITYDIRGNFAVGTTDVIEPDKITLNDQVVHNDTKVKPGKYDLLVQKEGYEPISRPIEITPDERPYNIQGLMIALPRPVIFELAGDYQENKQLTPDDISFSGRPVRVSGESVRPDNYLVVIRKKGYEPVRKRVLIEPKDEPFIFKDKMISLPRRVQPEIFASFPARERKYPDVCTLDGQDVNTTENFKPGSYTLRIQHPGYQPVTKKVEIPPSDEPYVIQEIIDPKDVELDFNVSYDVPPENPDIPFEVTLINEKTRESIKWKEGLAIRPESYLMKIERPGYRTHTERVLVSPREDRLVIDHRLNAEPRRVVTQITAEYPEGETLVPDQITLSNKPITKDFKITPGMHDLVILKEGYLPVRMPVKILASEKDFVLSRMMETRTRLVSFEFLDSYNRKKIFPQSIYVGGQQLASAAETISLKPGNYNLKAEAKGYAPIDGDTITIPVGSENFLVRRFMVAIKRDVIVEIVSDFSGEKMTPDVLTLNDTPVVEKASVKPGVYDVVIKKAGYTPITERVNIPPDPSPFYIRKTLISKPRKIVLDINSSFSGEAMTPQELTLGGETLNDGQNKKPGEYALLMKEQGYQPVSDNIVIEPSEDPYVLSYTLEAMPRLVTYDLRSDFNNEPVTPDIITLGEDIVDQKKEFLPGKYTVKIVKRGYHDKQMDIEIPPGDGPYVINGILASIAREIEVMITGDFPREEPIDPEVVALGNKDAREHLFPPGKYELVIQQPGYESMSKQVVIEPGEEPFLIQEVLVTKPRELKEKLSFDVPPPDYLGAHTITMAPLDKPNEEKTVRDGDMIKPNSYIMRIKKEAYRNIEVTKHVWPDESPLVIEETMVAKQVEIQLNITHDIEPPANLDTYKVSLIDPVTQVLNFVTDGKKIKPGRYELDIQQPGYTFGRQKMFEIAPSEQAYQIREQLIAKPRRLSFDMVFEGNLIPAHEVIDLSTGKKISFKDTFSPGTELALEIKFKKYQTVVKKTTVTPGDGPFLVNVKLERLDRYEFATRKNEMKLDGFVYPFELYADSKQIEDHLISMEKGFGRYYYTVWVSPDAKNLKVYAGYLYSQIPFDRLRLGVGRLDNIDVPKLIEHLDRVSKKDNVGRRASLEVLEKMLKSFSGKKKLRQVPSSEMDRLIQHVESWQLLSAQDRIRHQLILDGLNKLK